MMKKERKSRSVKYLNKFLEDLNYYNDETNTGKSNQPNKDSTQKHADTTTVGEHDQTSKESEYGLVMKCIELRQKVPLALSKSDIKYDKGLVMKLFHRNLESGLLSSYVVQEIKPLLRSSVSDEDLITAVSKTPASEKERNLALGKKKPLQVHEVGGARPGNSPGTSDNKFDKLVAAVELLTKQVSTLQPEVNNIKGDGYKANVSDDSNSGNRRGKNVILCKIVKIIIEPLVAIVLNVACLTIWQWGVATHHQAIMETERDCWYCATSNQGGFAQKVL